MTLLYGFKNIILSDSVSHSGDQPGCGGSKIERIEISSRDCDANKKEEFFVGVTGDPAILDVIIGSNMRLGMGTLAMSTSIDDSAKKEVLDWFTHDNGNTAAWFFHRTENRVYVVSSGFKGREEVPFSNAKWAANAVIRAGSGGSYLEDILEQVRNVVSERSGSFVRVQVNQNLSDKEKVEAECNLIRRMIDDMCIYAHQHLNVWNARFNSDRDNTYYIAFDECFAEVGLGSAVEFIVATTLLDAISCGEKLNRQVVKDLKKATSELVLGECSILGLTEQDWFVELVRSLLLERY